MTRIRHARMMALAIVLAGVIAGPVLAQTVATVDGKIITRDELNLAESQLAAQLPAQLQGPARDAYVLDYLIDLQLVANKAEADKVPATPQFQTELHLLKNKLLMQSVMSNLAKTAVTPATIQAAYDAVKAKQPPQEEIHARHILVKTEAEAEAVEKRLKAGEDFTKVATEVSIDKSAPGGDLGWFTKDKMVPAFSAAAFKLKPGQISAPVKTQFGWHVIKVEGTRDKPFPPLDQVKAQVSNFVLQQAQAKLIRDLHKNAKIVDSLPAPAPASAPAPAAKTSAPATPAAPAAATPAKPAAPAAK
ncbi:MAG: peptidylprolyl isomerase [Hyphomicrobiales bacterium]|nr:peptidylprolyl isomerase [Hyphomicrobiales bacterium]